MGINARQYALGLLESVENKKPQEIKEIIQRLIAFLVENNDVSKLKAISESFIELWNEKNGIVEAEIKAIGKLSTETKKDVMEYLTKKTGAKEIKIKEVEEKELLGGVVIRHGDKVTDGSLKTMLMSLQEVMKK